MKAVIRFLKDVTLYYLVITGLLYLTLYKINHAQEAVSTVKFVYQAF